MLRQKLAENWQWTVLCLILMLSTIYARPLIPIDETRYLSVAWEMWHSNDFLVPHINGHPYSHKPPLLFWLIHVSWLLFGVSEWSARLVGPFFAFGSVALTVHLGKILWPANKAVRLAAPFILLGTFVWSLYGSLTMFDALLTFIALLALLAILAARRAATILPWSFLSLAIGLGILAKGPIVLLYVLPPVLLAPLWSEKDTMPWGKWYGSSFLALLAGIGIALCWAIPAAIQGGEEYRQAILFSQTAGRMVKAFAHGRPFYWYALLLPLLYLPWFFWLPAWRGWKKKSFDAATRFCLCALLPAFFLLSCVSGKQIHYILPLLPVSSLLIAHTVTTVPKRTPYDQVPLLVIFLMLSLALLIVPQLSLHGGDREMLQYLPKWIAVVPFSAGLFLYMTRPESMLKSVKIVSSSMLLLVILLQLALADPLHTIYDQTVIGEKIKQAQDANKPVAVFPPKLMDQFQFSGRLLTPVTPQNTFEELVIWSVDNPQAFCLVFTKIKINKQSKTTGIARQYSDGWLIFSPAKDFVANYQQWIAQPAIQSDSLNKSEPKS
ncbi:glycosyltransferase family 39 protein [Desulfopila sp. IMCC35006]|nr:glycosyltransferase family 39 protein [Desulfopila sp. IMCC35006]